MIYNESFDKAAGMKITITILGMKSDKGIYFSACVYTHTYTHVYTIVYTDIYN